MADSPALPTRRSVLALGLGGVGGLLLVACSDDAPPGTREPATPGGLAPDVAVATRALTEIRAAREAAAATLARFPESRPTLAPLVAMHRAHEATLADAVPERARPSTTPAPSAVPAKQPKAMARLAAREQRLHDTLDTLALRAQSGQFARLLASMGTGIHQRLAGWPA